MILTIPNKVSWRKKIVTDNLNHYSKNIAKRIGKTHTHSQRDNILYSIEKLTPDLLEWFNPIYIKKISGMHSPVIYDLQKTTLGNTEKSYSILILTENDIRVGGIIFSSTEKEINIAYKIFEDSWTESTLPASPSLYADYLLTHHGLLEKKVTISHGKDRNGYGTHSNIGLAIFKISLGYRPYLPKEYLTEEVNTFTLTKDSLYFTKQLDSESPLEGHVFSTTETVHEWSRLKSYADNVSIRWNTR